MNGLAMRMAVKGGTSVSEAERLAGELTEILREALLAGDEVRLNRFGRMRVVERSGEAWDPKRKRRTVRRWRRVIIFKSGIKE